MTTRSFVKAVTRREVRREIENVLLGTAAAAAAAGSEEVDVFIDGETTSTTVVLWSNAAVAVDERLLLVRVAGRDFIALPKGTP